ncbi:hypothetical protein NQ038_07620 [Brevibacterium sp. 50QC2O2]|jgi:hypothetical protein|uniref:hypothetical protein n=1 Tax=Brevibacterium sp. 50QC2O2 TaxID=2968459 RepID=UPI00211C0DC1|nr:hypothetical protein [Brevibacterium sp. 50QC2O2]MCQ9388514.1 hypothetical protein [Brevibacterium sp. 50QC2O2]
MKSVKQRARFTKLWAGIAALGLVASLSACNADEATAGDGDAAQGADTIEAAQKAVDDIQKDDALADKLPEKYKESMNV